MVAEPARCGTPLRAGRGLSSSPRERPRPLPCRWCRCRARDHRRRPRAASDRVAARRPMTRIADVKAYPVSVPRPEAVWTAHEELKAWSVILVEVRTDDGLTGYGEIHGAPVPRICEWVARFGEIVRGMDALAHEAVWEKLFALTSPRPGAIDGKQMRPVPRSERTAVIAAIGGIDIALWDIKGKAAGLPVWRLLGGVDRPLVTYATGGYYRPGAPNAAYAEEMARLVGIGYRAVKLKTGAEGTAANVERIATVRQAIGDETDLMLDMNAPYDLPECIERKSV